MADAQGFSQGFNLICKQFELRQDGSLLGPIADSGIGVSLDHLVGGGEQRRRHVEAKRLRSFEIHSVAPQVYAELG